MAAGAKELVDELARVCNDPGVAQMLVVGAGFPAGDLPAFGVPRVFWHEVIHAAGNGKIRGGVQAIVEKVAAQFPGNGFFASYRPDVAVDEHELPGTGPAVSVTGDPAPPSDPDAARLELLYELLAEHKINDKDTTAIDAEILELRRRKRHGPTLHAGEHLGQGRFRLVEVLGQGGFAVVWKAYDNKERRLVAVKVLHGELAREESRRERLFRGARRMAELQHPNVVQVWVPEGEEQGFYYFVMELVTGGDLHRAVIDGKLDSDRGLTVIESIADALAAAHEGGLVHRDVKPENILLRENGAPVLSDFDLVQAKDTTGGTRTNAMGSVLYAAPEQNEDASRVDHLADVYSLGMTAVFCVYSKKLPHTAIYDRDAFLSELECTQAVRDVLERAVALEPGDRFESMTSFRLALAAARPGGDDERTQIEVEPQQDASEPLPAMTSDPAHAVLAAARQVIDAEPSRMQVRERPAADTHVAALVKVVQGVELVLVPGGRFLMGSAEDDEQGYDGERPQHEVELSSFWLARTPVTNAQYRKYLDANPGANKPGRWDDPNYNQDAQPVVGVSWEEARAYCTWAGMVLPTEAQWEYACRAGTTTRYYSGDSEEDLAKVGWYRGNSGYQLHPVGELKPNGFGLHDMHGNVWEWCEDAYGSYATSARAGDGLRHEPAGDAYRVSRGGSFRLSARFARSACRVNWLPVSRSYWLGFRPAQGHPS